MKNGKLTKKNEIEFLHLSSACMINITDRIRIEVWLYSIVGHREDFKYFEDIRSYTEYLEYRRKKIENCYEWRERKILREKRMRLDYFIRKKMPRSILALCSRKEVIMSLDSSQDIIGEDKLVEGEM